MVEARKGAVVVAEAHDGTAHVGLADGVYAGTVCSIIVPGSRDLGPVEVVRDMAQVHVADTLTAGQAHAVAQAAHTRNSRPGGYRPFPSVEGARDFVRRHASLAPHGGV